MTPTLPVINEMTGAIIKTAYLSDKKRFHVRAVNVTISGISEADETLHFKFDMNTIFC